MTYVWLVRLTNARVTIANCIVVIIVGAEFVCHETFQETPHKIITSKMFTFGFKNVNFELFLECIFFYHHFQILYLILIFKNNLFWQNFITVTYMRNEGRYICVLIKSIITLKRLLSFYFSNYVLLIIFCSF